MDKEKKVQLCIWANEEEVSAIERIKKHCERKTTSDAIRYLIMKEDKKILSKNVAIPTN